MKGKGRHAVSGAAVQAWDLAFTTPHIGISGGGLVATGLTGVTTGDYSRGLIGRTSGKVFWQVAITIWNGGSSPPDYIGAIGLMDGIAAPPDAQSVHSGGYYSDGQFYFNTLNPGGGVPYALDGAVVSGAANLTTKKIWYRTDNGIWFGSGGIPADPVAETDGADFTGMGPTIYPYVDIRIVNAVLTANFGATAYAFGGPPDASFLNWV